ncbi:MAG: Tfp pilus assembly protein PilF [Anaerolineaceae bacterium]|nr:Tfp pilus assembly protein PilF [Anaerolineaceae bacterium]
MAFNGAEEGQSDLVSDDTVAGLLASHQIPIAILNACQSGKQVGASETSLGSRLMAEGVQNALAMGYSVSVSAAKLLMTSLYEQLLDGKPLAQAVRRGRLELRNDKTRRAAYNQTIELEDWLLPVMYQNREIALPITDFATPEAEAAYFEQQSRRYRAPALTYGFFGRDVDILDIETHLLTQSNVLLIQGMGGAGKTTLLRHLMEWEQTTQLVERVFYFGYDEKAYTAAQIMDRLARDLYGADYTHAFSPLPDGAKLEKLAQTLRSERHLLVLDNLESITGAALSIQHTLDAAEQAKLRHLLERLAGGKTLVLLGSRGREAWLWGDGLTEQVYELPGLDREAASDLAKEILQRHKTDHYLADEVERPALTQLLKLLDGHPLALEIVLPNLSRQTPTELLAAFTEGDVGVDVATGSAGGEVWQDKTASILRCVEYSHSNLSPQAQALLACLAPFTGVFRAEWLPQYTEQLQQQPELADLPFDEWQTVLQEGVNWGLLTPHEMGGGYLRLQPILPYFLRQRLNHSAQAPFREAVEAAFCAHYDAVGNALGQLITSKQPQERQIGLALTNLEYENLMTALKMRLQLGLSIVNVYRAFSPYWNTTKNDQEALAVGQLIVTKIEEYDDNIPDALKLDFSILFDVAQRFLSGKQYQLAESTYHRVLDWLQNTVKNRQATSMIYHQLGMVAEKQRQWETAVAHYEKALAIFIEFNDWNAQAKAYHQLGMVAQEQRQWETAAAHYEKALALKIEFNDRHGQASTYHQMGIVAQKQRQWETAVAHYEKALAIYVEFNDGYSQAPAYFQLGRVAQEQRQWDTAVARYEKALAITIEFGGGYDQARIYHQLGIVAQEQRQWDTAVAHYEKALAIYLEFNDRYEQAGTYHQLGRVAHHQRHWDTAVAYYEKALAITVEFGGGYDQARIYHQLGNVAQAQWQWKTAVAHYEKALAIYIEFNDRYRQAGTYHQLGIVAEAQEQWQSAIDYFFKAIEIYAHYPGQNQEIALGSLARVWQAGQTQSATHLEGKSHLAAVETIPARLAAVLNISPAEAEALLNNQAGESGSS